MLLTGGFKWLSYTNGGNVFNVACEYGDWARTTKSNFVWFRVNGLIETIIQNIIDKCLRRKDFDNFKPYSISEISQFNVKEYDSMELNRVTWCTRVFNPFTLLDIFLPIVVKEWDINEIWAYCGAYVD